jgi:predicted DNA-binding transcriptional regulator AlpA
MRDFMRRHELVEYLGISSSTLRRWELRYHDFPRRKKIERAVYYDLHEVRRWVRSRGLEDEGEQPSRAPGA